MHKGYGSNSFPNLGIGHPCKVSKVFVTVNSLLNSVLAFDQLSANIERPECEVADEPVFKHVHFALVVLQVEHLELVLVLALAWTGVLVVLCFQGPFDCLDHFERIFVECFGALLEHALRHSE